ncbi:MAG: ABC transporter permease [Parahaliea sp.]
MPVLISLMKKELLLMRRDLHGLALLFVMPAVFILVMTFALNNQYGISQDAPVDYHLLDRDGGALARTLIDGMTSLGHFRRLESGGEDSAVAATARDDVQFSLIIEPDFEAGLKEHRAVATLLFAPGIAPAFSELVSAEVGAVLNRLYVEYHYGDLLEDADREILTRRDSALLQSRSLYRQREARPSSVQQNVPAWLLFAMFFLAVPLSTTLITERRQGTLRRLTSMGLTPAQLLAGKLVPYLLVNLLQVLLLFLIGIYLVPALGGERLGLGAHPEALPVIGLAASLAAVSFGLLIAQVAATVEQATVLSAVCNIIMAAVGGVMVPRFIMPPAMQTVSDFSPMAWGLQGFLDVLLRDCGIVDILPEALALSGFAAVLLVLAVVLARYQSR